MRRKRWLFLLTACLLFAGCSRRRGPGPLSPAEALQSFRLGDEFRIELFAAEPHVLDPVELVFDERGRAFVAEMLDLPDDPPPGKPPRSRIRMLEDRDGDGRIDQSTVFGDQLLQVTSMLPWNQGLIVAAAPHILYLKDTDDDGKADVRQVLFTGFALVNSEHRITNLRYCVNNWIYASNSGQPGNITFSERPEAPAANVLGADFRFRLDRRLFEAESGPTQFGQAMDDWGHRFITQSGTHVRHVVMPRRYFDRNPLLAATPPAQDISDHGQPTARIFPLTKPQYWREVRTRMRQQRYRENDPSRKEVAGGVFTAAAGGTIYSGDLLPQRFRGNLFNGDVSANLVHRDLLQPHGVSFRASRAPEEREREFLASTDPWFRPCNFSTGPDGALYVVDMYREFIETPESIPEVLKKEMDFYSGDTMGRIYRIVPKNAPPSKGVKPQLARAPASELVPLLSHPNGWWRLTAQRLILERQDRNAIPQLVHTLHQASTAQARLHALYALEGLSALEPSIIEAALRDQQAEVREHAVQLAERYPELGPKLMAMVQDPAPPVRFHLALSLGEFLRSPMRDTKRADRMTGDKQPTAREDSILEALAVLLSQQIEDPWFRTAVLSSTPRSSVRLLAILARNPRFQQPGAPQEDLLRELAFVVGARHDAAEVAALLDLLLARGKLATEGCQTAGLAGLDRGLQVAAGSRLKSPRTEALLARGLASPWESVRAAARRIARHFEIRALIAGSLQTALNPNVSVAEREAAIHSLSGGAFSQVRPVLEKLLDAAPDLRLHQAAVGALASFDDPAVSEILITRWSKLGPGIRNEVLDAFLSHRDRVGILLQALEGGRIERGSLDLQRREKLLRNPDAEISRQAQKVFHQESTDRAAVLQSYQPVIRETGDSGRGKAVFEKTCAICHLPRAGRRIGPDLSGVSSRTREQLLQDILDPSRSIAPAFTNYVIITKDNRIHDGLIAGETAATLTLRRSETADETILRSNIKAIKTSAVSLMPDGLEQGMSQQDIVNLIAYLQAAELQ